MICDIIDNEKASQKIWNNESTINCVIIKTEKNGWKTKKIRDHKWYVT